MYKEFLISFNDECCRKTESSKSFLRIFFQSLIGNSIISFTFNSVWFSILSSSILITILFMSSEIIGLSIVISLSLSDEDKYAVAFVTILIWQEKKLRILFWRI